MKMKPLIIANWKMNPTSQEEAKNLFDAIKKGIDSLKAEVVICPPFVYLPLFAGLTLGGQNCFFEEKGAFTGEISPAMLKNLGCEYVIVGHSERRRMGETNEIINKKIKAALEAGLIPILCIGETQEQRNRGETGKVLESQLKGALAEIKNLVVAYEPVWAIGTGNPCEPPEAQKTGEYIRKIIPQGIRVLYGGSVNSKNAKDYVKVAGFDGLLVGGASLSAEEFIKIAKSV